MTSQYKPNIYEKIGTALKEIRKEKNLTMKDIQDMGNINIANTSLLERGKQNFTMSSLIHYCNVLDVDPTEVFLRAFREDFQIYHLNKMYEKFGPYETDEDKKE